MPVKPKPLRNIVGKPSKLLAKAAHDLKRLERATADPLPTDDADVFAFIDACAALYHIKDWIAVSRPGYKVAAREWIEGAPWLVICRDVCTASKHVGLAVEHPAFASAPPLAEDVGYTMGAHASHYPLRRVIKVRTLANGDHYAPDVVRKAIEDWQKFFAGKDIDWPSSSLPGSRSQPQHPVSGRFVDQ